MLINSLIFIFYFCVIYCVIFNGFLNFLMPHYLERLGFKAIQKYLIYFYKIMSKYTSQSFLYLK